MTPVERVRAELRVYESLPAGAGGATIFIRLLGPALDVVEAAQKVHATYELCQRFNAAVERELGRE